MNNKEQMILDYLNGMTSNEASIRNGFKSHHTCLNELKRLGIKSRTSTDYKIYSSDDNYFSNIDTEEKAYWLGFIAADGCLFRKSDIRISLGIIDYNHLVKFKNCIKSTYPIKIGKSFVKGKNYQNCQFNINSRKIFDDLISLNITPRKSHTLQPSKIDKKLERHYWRGIFDGDGAIYTGTKYKNGLYQWRFDLCGSKAIIEGYKDFVFRNIQENIKVESRRGIFYSQCCGSQKPFKLAKLLYENANIYLDRKMEKYKLLYIQNGN